MMKQNKKFGLSGLRCILFALLIGMGASLDSFAGNWEKKYLADEFGDADYSKPIYYLQVNPVGGYGACVSFYYVNGIFAMDFIDAHVFLEDVVSMSVKSSSGQIRKLEFEEIGHEPTQYALSEKSSDLLLRLLDEGNFSISVKTPIPLHYGETHNHAFKIGKEGNGIAEIALSDYDYPEPMGHEGQGQGDLFKGTLGKSAITMHLNTSYSSQSNPDIYPVVGEYWYGSGKNGKMTLKGTLSYTSEGVYRLDEYDPQGKKCGSFVLKQGYDPNTWTTILTGTMTNKAGTTYKVSLTQQ